MHFHTGVGHDIVAATILQHAVFTKRLRERLRAHRTVHATHADTQAELAVHSACLVLKALIKYGPLGVRISAPFVAYALVCLQCDRLFVCRRTSFAFLRLHLRLSLALLGRLAWLCACFLGCRYVMRWILSTRFRWCSSTTPKMLKS